MFINRYAHSLKRGKIDVSNRKAGCSLEEIIFAVDAVAPTEALLRQLRLAVAAFQAFAVPVAIQHLENKAVHDVLTAARTDGDFCGKHDGIAVVKSIENNCEMTWC